MMKIFCILLLASLQVSATQTGGQEKVRFWKDYRESFLNKNMKKLSSMTNFPMSVLGELDDDETFNVTDGKFSNCFQAVFEKDPGLSSTKQTHLNLVKITEDLAKLKSPGDERRFRVGDLEFEKVKGTFKLVRLYLDTSLPEIKKACK